MPYFNHRVHVIDAAQASWWERREFVQAWWSLYADDRRWTPPEYTALRRELDPRRNSHLARQETALVYVDALQRSGAGAPRPDQPLPTTGILERPLAAAVALIDPRRRGKTAHVALLHLSNDYESFERLYYRLVEDLSFAGYRRMVGPVGLSPHLGGGILVDSWNLWPPAHTPSNPPYVPELLERKFRPLSPYSRLYHKIILPGDAEAVSGPAVLTPLEPGRLAGDLLPLLAAATENPSAGFPPPDADEAAFLLRWLRPETLIGWVAESSGRPAGFVLLQADAADQARRAGGGRRLWQRIARPLWQARKARAGRLLFAAVTPELRGQGIGGQLWVAALETAAARGWQSLAVGPLPHESAATAFVENRGAVAGQTYRLYEAAF